MDFILSIYFGFHDSCITISDKNKILLHLEAERYFRKKHLRLTKDQMIELIGEGLKYLNISIENVSKIYLAKWNNQFNESVLNIYGKKFEPIFTSHHENHVGTALASELNDILVVCADGGSEDGTTKIYHYKNRKLKLLEDLDKTIMTGRFYGTLTQIIISPIFGRAHDTYPGKTMGLASLGKFDVKLHKLISEKKDEMNKLHFEGCSNLNEVFDISSDYNKPWLDQKRCDLAYTGQDLWIKCFIEKINEYSQISKNIAIVGGCAYNALLNSEVRNLNLFENIYITPVSGDCGQSLGAILFHNPHIKCNYPYLGRSFGEADLDVVDKVVEDLLLHKIICWYNSNSEIGPRALGNRSFIGLADTIAARNKLSQQIKKREPYRPVAPVICADDYNNYFEGLAQTPFMTFAPRANEITLKLAPAIVHYDGTSRVQTVTIEENKIIYLILKKIKEKGKAPILMNSSLNVDGEPIVDTPQDCIQTFKKSGADVLYLNGKKYEQKDV